MLNVAQWWCAEYLVIFTAELRGAVIEGWQTNAKNSAKTLSTY